MGSELPSDRFRREWASYLESHGHRVTQGLEEGPAEVQSQDGRGRQYRWLVRSEAGDSVLLGAAERKQLRRQMRLARRARERCFLVVKFGSPVGRVVALPAAQALRRKRVSAATGGIPWDG
jgi:hypothetical protein